jgi:endonuclease-8
MPEGPEIRRATDRLAEALLDQRAEVVALTPPRLADYGSELTGQRIVSVGPRGKAVLIGFAGGLTLYSHNQLYGRWYVQPAGGYPKTNRQLRVEIRTARRAALLYSASDIAVLDADGLRQHAYLASLGPDALDPATEPDEVAARLRDRAFSRRRLAGLLLDQAFVAGLGNYLRSEILWFARLHPNLRPCDLDDDQRAELAECILTVTRRSYATGGVTAEAAFVAARRGQPRRTWRHMVFARADQACPGCSEPIAREVFGGRRLYLCATCRRGPTR